MAKTHDDLLRDTLARVRDIHGDTSVSMEKTVESLEEIRDECRDLIALVKHDIENREA